MADIPTLSAQELHIPQKRAMPQSNFLKHQGTQMNSPQDVLVEKKRKITLMNDSKLDQELLPPFSSSGRANSKAQRIPTDCPTSPKAVDSAVLQTWFSDSHDAATPLVLIKRALCSANQVYEKAEEKIAERHDTDSILQRLQGYDIYLYHPHHISPPAKLNFPNSATDVETEPLIEAFLCAGRIDESLFDAAVAKTIFSAALKSSILGYKNLHLAAFMTEQLDPEMQSLALDEALFSCRGELGASLAKQLLLEGANPNAAQQIDDFQCLTNAVVNLDRPMVKALLSAGANADLDNDTHGTTRCFLKDDQYASIRDLFEPKK